MGGLRLQRPCSQQAASRWSQVVEFLAGRSLTGTDSPPIGSSLGEFPRAVLGGTIRQIITRYPARRTENGRETTR